MRLPRQRESTGKDFLFTRVVTLTSTCAWLPAGPSCHATLPRDVRQIFPKNFPAFLSFVLSACGKTGFEQL